MKKTKEVDMTQGNIFSHLVVFALPLLLGNIFQQLYNTVDTWVVGNYVGKVSFSAVGTLGPVVNTFIGFFTGFSSGAGVVISRNFGAKNFDGVRKSVHTFVATTLIFCVITTILGLLLIPVFLNILDSPAEVAVEQRIYLIIYFAGITGLLIYNSGAAILRAVGNSTVPFIFLVITTVLNIVLDLLFVIKFNMGTAGVAYATIIAQGISAFLVCILLFNSDSSIKLSIKDIYIDKEIFKEILRIGLPSAFQIAITSFSNIFVQSYVNYFGTDVMGGWTAYSKIDQICFLPMQSIGIAVMTFVGQNLGASDIKRARKGTNTALIMCLAIAFLVAVPMTLQASTLVSFFIDNNESGVISYGSLFLRVNGSLVFLACFHHVFANSLRGAGESRLPMIVILSSYVVFRQIYLYIMTNFIANTPFTVSISFPLGWLVCSILISILYIIKFPKENA